MNIKFVNYIFCAFALFCFSCEDIVPEEKLVYFNDFDNGDFPGISGVKISSFDGDFVMGNFNNNGFQLSLDNLPDHEYVRVSFDLYIHDSWDGNTNGTNPLGQDHDAWILEFDPNENLKSSEKIYFETTFSNGLCIPGFCYSQSYPREFPFPNDSKLEAFSTSLPGLCAWKDSPNGTSLYKFDKVFLHKRNSTTISFYDRLVQPNSDNPLCDESWSLDNLSISVFKKR